jgi:plasmid stabilization system protein ParE
MTAAALELHPDAVEDALDGFSWYLQSSERTAAHFFAELERAVQLILEHPEAWPSYILGTRRFILTKFPYSIIYKAQGDRTVVYAFAHAKRRPRYWKDRLAPRPVSS